MPAQLTDMTKLMKTKRVPVRQGSGSSRLARERKYKPREGGVRAAPVVGQGVPAAVVDAEHVRAVWQRWLPLLQGVPADPPRMSIDPLLGEAARVALLYEAYWQPRALPSGSGVPGFSTMAPASVLHEQSGYELLELVTAIVKADADAARGNEAVTGSPMSRAVHVLREIKTSLEFVFDDAEHSGADEQLAALAKKFSRPRSHDALAVALEAYAALADEHRAALGKLPVFDLGVLDEAWRLAGALRSRSGEAKVRKLDDALATRNQLLALLQDRLGRIRRTARLLFRDHPEIARKFTSERERTARRERRARRGEPRGDVVT
jgi:hypothetical protein